MSPSIGTLRQVIVSVDDVPAAVDAYRGALGLTPRFVDGDRWAAFDACGLTLALAGPGEQPPGGGVALGVKVADLEAALHQARAEGAEQLQPMRVGDHERRVAYLDRFGTTVILYEPLA